MSVYDSHGYFAERGGYMCMRIHVSVSENVCEDAGDLPQLSFTFISIYFIFFNSFSFYLKLVN